MSTPLLKVDGLQTHFDLPRGVLRAVDGVSFTLEAGRTLGIVGESGSGKSVLARSIIGLLPADRTLKPAGVVEFGGRDLRRLSEPQMREIRGREIAMIFQDPMTSLNPVLTIGRQIEQVLLQHTDLSKAAARTRAVELLAEVGIPDPQQRAKEYAHRMSGGMRQRIVIAIALACAPRLLIADEPTTALDVTVQAQILDLLRRLQDTHAMAMMLITHNLGVVAEMCDDVAVMYAGQIVERGSVADVLQQPAMRYTQALLQSVPRTDSPSHVRLPVIDGQPPNLIAPPAGCRFAARCAHRSAQCDREQPAWTSAGPGHGYACWHPVVHA
ncbi:MAG TPA: ABC transporter ATP-binding protein [Quisquiliibacterium sp.]|nr:ABC transporter ATP-binding protein [Quisquiliibacterium sp.]HPA89339.1 ABC transporter ATP-binding protein [Quisquiliibacterium sp.]HQD82862.1 ABC transporter ATP-binding protein [Quisquiliibacterium sp.]HQN12330.1 ABC transporter ATP-binding protein [Quisquiliibacterium sp.]HQP67769.1 ABC transporter ATP-binding protein [Quisquiliibacterium sp.]